MPRRNEASHQAMIALFEREEETLDRMIERYHEKTHERMPWRVVSAARLTKIWEDAARDGFVRDENGLRAIADRFVENVIFISVNTEISGHKEVDGREKLKERFDSEDEIDAFIDWAIETETGWRISDYAMEDMIDLAALATETESADALLVVVDRMLNLAHQRSDLASWFVEGGTRTLTALAEGVRPTERTVASPAP